MWNLAQPSLPRKLLGVLGASALAISLASCGGGGSSSSGGGGASVVPSPTPTPTPSPTPTPAAVTYSTMAGGPLIGILTWIEPSGVSTVPDFVRQQITSSAGLVGPGIAPVDPRSGSALPRVNSRDVRIFSGTDTLTGMSYSELQTPNLINVVSPLSAITFYRGFGARAQLGLNRGEFALDPATDAFGINPWAELSNSNAILSRDAGRLISLNVQLVALAGVLRRFSGDPLNTRYEFDTMARVVADVLEGGRSIDLANPNDVDLLLQRRFSEFPLSNCRRRAELVARYMSAVPPRISDAATARGWLYLFRYVIFPDYQALGSSNVEISNAFSPLSTQEMTAMAAQLGQIIPQSRGVIFAAPDYVELVDKTRNFSGKTVVSYQLTLNGCEERSTPLPTCNDRDGGAQAPNPPPLTEIVSFDPAALAVTLQGQTLTIRQSGNYSGLTLVRYRVRLDDGTELVGNLFVRVRSPEASLALCNAAWEWCQV